MKPTKNQSISMCAKESNNAILHMMFYYLGYVLCYAHNRRYNGWYVNELFVARDIVQKVSGLYKVANKPEIEICRYLNVTVNFDKFRYRLGKLRSHRNCATIYYLGDFAPAVVKWFAIYKQVQTKGFYNYEVMCEFKNLLCLMREGTQNARFYKPKIVESYAKVPTATMNYLNALSDLYTIQNTSVNYTLEQLGVKDSSYLFSNFRPFSLFSCFTPFSLLLIRNSLYDCLEEYRYDNKKYTEKDRNAMGSFNRDETGCYNMVHTYNAKPAIRYLETVLYNVCLTKEVSDTKFPCIVQDDTNKKLLECAVDYINESTTVGSLKWGIAQFTPYIFKQ